MKIISRITNFVLILLSFFLCSCQSEDRAGDVIIPENTITHFLSENENYSSLARALEITGLHNSLDGTSKYSIFAPNNAAFNAYLSQSAFESLNEVPEDSLRQLLLYHILNGGFFSEDFPDGYYRSLASTGASGHVPLSLYIENQEDFIVNGGPKLVNPDIPVENGVVHFVDRVIELPRLMTFVRLDPDLKFFNAALERTSGRFLETLEQPTDSAHLTLFVPTDEAFEALALELELEGPEAIPLQTLEEILGYHMITASNINISGFSGGMEQETLQGDTIRIDSEEGIRIIDAHQRRTRIVRGDLQTLNGVLHILDTVLLPGTVVLPEEETQEPVSYHSSGSFLE